MIVIQNMNLLLRLLLELCVLVAVGYWGFRLKRGYVVRWGVGIGAPLLIMVVWSMFIAPNSAYQLPLPARLCTEIVVFGIGAYALWTSISRKSATAFSSLVILNMILLLYWKQ